MPLMPPQGFATPSPPSFHSTAHTRPDGAAADVWSWVVTVVWTLGLCRRKTATTTGEAAGYRGRACPMEKDVAVGETETIREEMRWDPGLSGLEQEWWSS